MKPINLYAFFKAAFLAEKELQVYEKLNSNRNNDIKIKNREIQTLDKLISIISSDIDYKYWDGFYYSFFIPQISKEFDLLKLGSDRILNIELKSDYTSYEKILNQLIRNQYYLSHLNKEIIEIVFVGSENKFYKLADCQLYEILACNVVQEIKSINEFYNDDIEPLFKPTQFLVSPINTPEKFISGKYFLTSHQEEIKNAILKSRKDKPNSFSCYHIVGGAGTGKTLLIYDLARQFAQTFKICVIHCAFLADGHSFLNSKLNNVTIISIKDLFNLNCDGYDGFIIDEAHRLDKEQLKWICDSARQLNKFLIFGMDAKQYLTRSEQRNNINEEICKLDGCEHYHLTNKIRTNKELADFIHLLRNIKDTVDTKCFPNVKILYADTYEYANKLILVYKEQGYKYISFTPSKYNRHNIDKLYKDENTHKVIGQEFDNVLMVINESFEYMEDGRLGAYDHPVHNYLFAQLLYQGLTRVREKLAIIVLNNKELFVKLLTAIDSAIKK